MFCAGHGSGKWKIKEEEGERTSGGGESVCKDGESCTGKKGEGGGGETGIGFGAPEAVCFLFAPAVEDFKRRRGERGALRVKGTPSHGPRWLRVVARGSRIAPW